MDKRTFISYQALDFLQKPELDATDKIPKGIFNNTCLKDVTWAIPISRDWKTTIIDMLCTAPNNCGVLVIFDSDDYHKINKIKWERYVYEDKNTSPHDWTDFIDDSISDDMAEFVVSFESMKIIELLLPPIAMSNGDIDKFAPGKTFKDFFKDAAIITEYRNLNQLYKQYFNNVKPMDSISERSFQAGLACVLFSTLYLPLLLVPLSNGIYNQQEGLLLPWAPYCEKYIKPIMKAKSDISEFFYTGCTGGEAKYKELRNKLMDYYDFPNLEVYDARLHHFERNAPCPCGSGLKWKKCHGRIAL